MVERILNLHKGQLSYLLRQDRPYFSLEKKIFTILPIQFYTEHLKFM